MSTFLSQITNPERPMSLIKRLSSKVNGETIPIVFYGAGERALVLKQYLERFDLKVDGFFVSDGFINDPCNVFNDVFSFDEICKRYECFNVVIARGEVDEAEKFLLEKNNSQICGIYVLPYMPYKGVDLDFINKNIMAYEKVYFLLSDELSKKCFVASINACISSNNAFLREVFALDQYFAKDIVSLSDQEVFVDGGAFIGDTLSIFAQRCKGSFAQYHAFEPDKENFIALQRKIKDMNLQNVASYNIGLWSNPGNLMFNKGNGPSSTLCSANMTNAPRGEYATVQVDTIDRLCPNATFIKMDIEGAELEALKGAVNTIRCNRPKLAICVYHKREDLFEIPLFIHSIEPSYDFYLRHHAQLWNETVLYAIPPK